MLLGAFRVWPHILVEGEGIPVKPARSATATNTHNILNSAYHGMICGVDLPTYLE